MWAVYLAIREFLANEHVSLQNLGSFAVKHLGIVVRKESLGLKVGQAHGT